LVACSADGARIGIAKPPVEGLSGTVDVVDGVDFGGRGQLTIWSQGFEGAICGAMAAAGRRDPSAALKLATRAWQKRRGASAALPPGAVQALLLAAERAALARGAGAGKGAAKHQDASVWRRAEAEDALRPVTWPTASGAGDLDCEAAASLLRLRLTKRQDERVEENIRKAAQRRAAACHAGAGGD